MARARRTQARHRMTDSNLQMLAEIQWGKETVASRWHAYHWMSERDQQSASSSAAGSNIQVKHWRLVVICAGTGQRHKNC